MSDETKATEQRFRVVSNEEMEILSPIFDRLGWPKPSPDFAKAVVAEVVRGDEALVAGFATVEFIPHISTLWVNPAVRGTGIAEGLADATIHYMEQDCHLKRYVCLAKPGSFSARLAEKVGMVRLPADAYMKQLA